MSSPAGVDLRVTLDVTGCCDGDLIKGNTGSSAEGGLLRIKFQEHSHLEIPRGKEKEVSGKYLGPWKTSIDKFRNDKERSAKLMTRLATFPLFARSANVAETLERVECAHSTQNIGWGFGGWVHVEVLRLPKKVENKLRETPDVLDMIPMKTWTIEDLMELIPAQSATVRKDMVTLAFQAGNWQYCFSETRTYAHKGSLVVDVESGRVMDGCPESVHHEIWPIENFVESYEKKQNSKWVPMRNATLYIRAPKIAFDSKAISSVNGLLNALGIVASNNQVESVVQSLQGFEQNASMLKSCLQKLIRFQPQDVSVCSGNVDTNVIVSAQIALVVVIWYLFRCKGGFNPDLQTWSSGLESLTKRLGVILFEDSSFVDPCDSVRLLGAALLAQRIPQWIPTEGLLVSWCRIALAAQASDTAYEYDCCFDGKPHVITANLSPLCVASALLDECGSFEGDVKMARCISSRPLKVVCGWNRPAWMPFPDHCIDQHTNPSMVYFFPRGVVDEVCETAKERGDYGFSAPFAPMMAHIFSVTGTNPRRHHQNFNDFEAVNRIVRGAQQNMLVALRLKGTVGNLKQRAVVGEALFTPEPLSNGWLAAMIGSMEEKVERKALLVTCTPKDPTKLVAIPAPSRLDAKSVKSKQDQLSNDWLIAAAVERGLEKLRKGVSLLDVPISDLDRCKAVLCKSKASTIRGENSFDDADEVFEIIFSGGKEKKTWEEFRHLPERCVPVHERIPFSLTAAYELCGAGIEEGAFESFGHILDETGRESVLRRLATYTSCRGKSFRMNLVSRSGSYLQFAVVLDDVDVFQLLLRICCLFPGALGVSAEPFQFVVKDRMLFWKLDKMVKSRIQSSQKQGKPRWPAFNDTRNYVPKPHQTESIDILLEKFRVGAKGSFLYMTVGMGKTLVVMHFLCELLRVGELPSFVFFVVPKSACLAVLQEIVAFGVQCDLVSPSKSSTLQDTIADRVPKGVTCITRGRKKGPASFRAGVITVIEDDDLVGLQEDVAAVVTDSIFIVDEVHKKMALTLRTSATLQLARLSRFFVALTGTPIIDSRATGLKDWLEMIVDFQVHPKNMWIAANEMISYKVSTGVFTEFLNVVAEFTDDEKERNRKLAPRGMGGFNPHARNQDFEQMSELAYEACTRKIVELACEFLDHGEGPGGCCYYAALEFVDEVSVRLEFEADTSSPPVWSLRGRFESIAVVSDVTFRSATGTKKFAVDLKGRFEWNALDGDWIDEFRKGEVKISVSIGKYCEGGGGGDGDGDDDGDDDGDGDDEEDGVVVRAKRKSSKSDSVEILPSIVPPIFRKESVMIVARNHNHAEDIANRLTKKNIKRGDVHVGSHNLTDYLVEKKGDKDFRVVIVSLSEDTGYTLTRLGVQISAVYPSNQAKREQIEGRINRIGQQRSTIQYRTVHCGILSYVLEKHQQAKSLSAALAEIAKSVATGELLE